MPPDTVCVDRTTGFGNPFPVGKGVDLSSKKDIWFVGTWTGPAMWILETKAEAQERAVAAYAAWIGLPGQRFLREKAIATLRGKNLACFCPLDAPCHADVLLKIVNTITCEGASDA